MDKKSLLKVFGISLASSVCGGLVYALIESLWDKKSFPDALIKLDTLIFVVVFFVVEFIIYYKKEKNSGGKNE